LFLAELADEGEGDAFGREDVGRAVRGASGSLQDVRFGVERRHGDGEAVVVRQVGHFVDFQVVDFVGARAVGEGLGGGGARAHGGGGVSFSVAHQRLRPDFPLLFDQLFPSSDPDPLLQIHDLWIAVVELVVGQFDISPAPDLFHSGNDRLGYAKVGILSIEFGVCSGKLTRGQEGEQTLAFRGPRKVPEQQKNTKNISFLVPLFVVQNKYLTR
jgi:hypothetical protein